jgi:hypothetical protein
MRVSKILKTLSVVLVDGTHTLERFATFCGKLDRIKAWYQLDTLPNAS